jgi:hypothetical protein
VKTDEARARLKALAGRCLRTGKGEDEKNTRRQPTGNLMRMTTIRSHVNPSLHWRFASPPCLKLEFQVQLHHPRRLCRNSLAEKG